jgi:energy-coupling factor transporter ATP-binding protein EcfA2
VHIKSVQFTGFKRFTETTISGIPETARLVVLAGPNGSGKSSLFDGFKSWHSHSGANTYNWDESYGAKVGSPPVQWTQRVRLSFHEPIPESTEEQKKLVYVRTAFRNEADFEISSFNRLNSPLDSPRVSRLIDNDVSVSENYQRLLMQTIDGIYDSSVPDNATKAEIRDRIIGQVQRAMQKVFPDLVLTGVGAISGRSGAQGTFYFRKGNSEGFLYKNLSAGEKAAFDLILDAVVKGEYYDNTIWCIDEPETHLNTRVQGMLLQTLVELIPPGCQLWIASHSLGFMRKAWEMAQADSASVAFVDMQDHDFDGPVAITPIRPSREFWARTLDVAMGDLAGLVAPEHLVLCEGRPRNQDADQKAAFDASCYQQIFADEFPNTDFISVGNSVDASQDRLELGYAIQALASGTRIDRLIDRDLRTDAEVEALAAQNVRVLSRRHIEAYLLDDEVITALCVLNGKPDEVTAALEIKAAELKASINRGNDPDDLKSAAGSIYIGLRRLLGLTRAGSTWHAFARDTLSPLIGREMTVYAELRADIFGQQEREG